jgi:hypothetical protein
MSLDAVPTCRDSSCMSPGVARSLSPLAPCLAPRNWLASLMFGWMTSAVAALQEHGQR